MTKWEGLEQAIEENPLALGLPNCERRVRGWLGVAEGSRSLPGCRAPRLVKALSDLQLFLVFHQEGILVEAFRFEHLQCLLRPPKRLNFSITTGTGAPLPCAQLTDLPAHTHAMPSNLMPQVLAQDKFAT